MNEAPVVSEIDVLELARRRDAGPVVLIDVREPDEFAEARVPGAQLMPLGSVPERLGELPTQETIHLICRSGARSMNAGEFLAQHGLDVVNIAGGTLAWIDAGHDVATGEPTP